MAAESTCRAMGTNVHIIVNGDDSHLTYIHRRLADLENKWSRFLPYSEITQLNNAHGEECKVSLETIQMIRHAIEGFEITNGLYDPTILGELLGLGYTVSFDDLDDSAPENISVFTQGCENITIGENNTVALVGGIGFDPGGIGKGFAADLIAYEALSRGADGAMINIGGDVRVAGLSPEGTQWGVDIANEDDATIRSVVLNHGAVATSTTRKRHWEHDGVNVHHIIDPRTGTSSHSPVVLASVIANQCWQAEVLSKALIIDRTFSSIELVESLGAAGMTQTSDGNILTTTNWDTFDEIGAHK